MHTSFSDLIPLRQRANIGEINLARPSEEEVALTTAKTKAAFDNILNGKADAANAKSITNSKTSEPTFIRYTPSSMMGDKAGGQRIIKMVDLPEDPMAPPKFKHTKVPRGPPSPPAPLLRSPPRKLTVKDQEDFAIPPSVSKWKNAKGYTIALDKRLAADGRGLQDVEISDNFAKLSEALYAADRHAREEVKQRALLQQRLADEEKERKEEHLRELARKVREERGEPRRRQRTVSPDEPRGRTMARGRSISRTPSGSGSRSGSYSSYDSRSRSGSYSRTPPNRRRSYSRSASRSRSGSYSRSPSRSLSGSRSRSRSYSRSPSRTPSRSLSRSRSRSRSLSVDARPSKFRRID